MQMRKFEIYIFVRKFFVHGAAAHELAFVCRVLGHIETPQHLFVLASPGVAWSVLSSAAKALSFCVVADGHD